MQSSDDWDQYLEESAKKEVFLDGDAIILDVSGRYEIALDRCDTPERLLGWIVHLCEKTWMTNAAMRRFIMLSADANEITIDRSG